MYRFSAYAVLLAAGLVAAGCSNTNNHTATGEANRAADAATTTTTAKGVAMVRYISAVDAHSNTDLYFGDERLFSTAGADKPTGYKEVPAERRDFVLRQAGKPDGMEIEKNSEGLSNGKHYTVVAYEDKDAKPVLKVFNDDESAPANGKAKVRIIHAAPAMDSVALYAAGHKDKVAGESSLTSASTWQDVDPVSGPFVIRSGGDKNGAQASVPIQRFEAGKLYTLIVEGGPKSGEKLHVVDVVDTPAS
jgi:hypothetical protein